MSFTRVWQLRYGVVLSLVGLLGWYGGVHAANIQGGLINNTFHMGFSVPWSHNWEVGPLMGSAIVVGIREVQRRGILPGYDIEWIWEDSWCEPLKGIQSAVEMWSQFEDMDVLIGDGCSLVCQPVGLLAASWGIPMVSFGCTSDKLSNKEMYPTFTRAVGPWAALAPMFDRLADVYGWNRIGIVTDTADLMRITAEACTAEMERRGKQVFYHLIEPTMTGDVVNAEALQHQKEVIKQIKKEVRIIIVITYGPDVRNILLSALDEGMLNGEYVFVAMDVGNLLYRTFTYRPEVPIETLLNGVLIGTPKKAEGPEYDAFAQEVIDAFQDARFDHVPHLPTNSTPDQVEVHAGMVHDAVLIWAYGVNKTLSEGLAPDDGFAVSRNIFNLTFQGISGRVTINEVGDRIPDYQIEIVQNGEMVQLLDWLAADGVFQKIYKAESSDDWSGITWHGNVTSIPRDQPPCGWNLELCGQEENQTLTTIIILSCVGLIIVVGVTIFIIMFIKKQKYEANLREMISVQVDWTDIQKDSFMTPLGASRLTLKSLRTNDTGTNQFFTDIGFYKGKLVAIRKLGDKASINMHDRQMLVELKQAKDISHENLVPFVGVCPNPPNVCILMLYATRGSLQDVLADEQINLTWEFKMSLVNDIVQGMGYLHRTAIGSHGRLTSANCVVDSRWTCKLSGYGLGCIRRLGKPLDDETTTEHMRYSRLLWTAPELLRDKSGSLNGSKKGDVFSFAIITQEIVLEGPPYEYNDPKLEPSEIIAKVMAKLKPPFRPTVSRDECDQPWINLMEKCWVEEPEDRPSFPTIYGMIKAMNGGRKVRLVDNMVKRLEAYTKDLEEIVEERCRNLQVEKSKVDMLLCELLPKAIAGQLKLGLQVAPEAYESTTIYLSDVVGFTKISAACSPMEVVTMLNSMYTMFDEIADGYDVYKVATIGDAYMVAGGLPIRNGDRHAGEITAMALDLLKSVLNFPIPHRPSEHLRLRVGIHSGSCVAAVVGMKMPRYLLFGATVDIAHIMESSGEPMKIHVSDSTAEAIRLDSRFLLECRGESYVKGRGSMITYWVLEEQSNTKRTAGTLSTTSPSGGIWSAGSVM